MVPRWISYALVAVVVSIIGLGFVLILYVDHVNSESNSRWCGVVSTLDDAYVENQPATPIGQRLAREFHHLRTDFGC